jgi:hypothetical protein
MVERPRPMCRHVDGVSRFAGKEDMVGCVYWLFFFIDREVWWKVLVYV